MIRVELRCPIFNKLVYFASGPHEKAGKWLSKKIQEEIDLSDCYGAVAICNKKEKNTGTCAIIYLSDPTNTANLVHEAYHLAEQILVFLEIEERNELMAYYLEYWFKRLSEIIRSETAKTNKPEK